MKVVIIGGVAGGANVAARVRRLSEEARVIVFERGPHVSFANCGLPYYIGGEIQDRQKLLVHTPSSLSKRFKIEVHTLHEVLEIDRKGKTLRVLDKTRNLEFIETYDQLVLSTGAVPFQPPIPGLDLPGIFTLRDIPDADRIMEWLSAADVRSAIVVGGGFIGLEMVEQLHRRGLHVTVIEAIDQVLAPLDPEQAAFIVSELRTNDVEVCLSETVQRFESASTESHPRGIRALTSKGIAREADIVIFGIGVRPETSLARAAGLDLGERGGIKVNSQLQTSDPSIWALGDCIEVENPVLRMRGLVPLAGPANRQGRIVADNIFGRQQQYPGTLGTAVLRVFKLTAAATGANERTLRHLGIPYQSVHVHSSSHASYYPGARPLSLKLIFSPLDGTLLGASAVGEDGVEKRIDVIATAMRGNLKIEDLVQVELCYAPPVGSAKDPVNIAAMAAENVLRGLISPVKWDDPILKDSNTLLLDVREKRETELGMIPGAIHLPLDELRDRLRELSTERLIIAYCHSGQRSALACRILSQAGYRCRNLSGAYRTWSVAQGMI